MWGVIGLTFALVLVISLVVVMEEGVPDMGFFLVLALTFGIVVVIGALFGSLTVEVTKTGLILWFGPGVARKRLDARDVRAFDTVTYPWWYGYGIRVTPKGVMYNVSGTRAVHLELSGGKGFMVGTDDPKGLEAALRKVTGKK